MRVRPLPVGRGRRPAAKAGPCRENWSAPADDPDRALKCVGVHRTRMGERLASAVGIAACLAVLALVAWPYLEAPVPLVALYYDSGPSRVTTARVLTPGLAAVLALAALAAFVAGRRGYLAGATAAGAALAFGLVATGVALAWALTARVDPFLARGVLLPAQRWLLVAGSALVAVAGGWYAVALGRAGRRAGAEL